MDELQCKIQQVMRQVSAAAVYREEPIVRPVRNHLPQKYLKMRALARAGKGGAALFYEQARFMEAQEDEFEYHGEFFAYYPTFLHMRDDQLRGYFSWRTKVRRGQIEETSLSYVFVYIYELLHLVGVGDATEGYRALKVLWESYRQYTSKLDWYMELWLHDFVIYYGLEQEGGDERNEAMERLLHPENGDLFDALCTLSSYHIERSKFYKVCPIDVEVLSERVYLRYSEYYAKHRSTSLEEHLFGKLVEMPYYMFQSAVFADPRKEDREYVLSDLCRYRCQAGRWFCTRLSCGRNTAGEIGMLLKCVDLVLRERAGFEPLKDPKLPKYLRTLVEKEADAFLALERLLKLKCAERLGLSGLDSYRPYFIQFKMKADKETFFETLRRAAEELTDPMELVYGGEVPLFEKYDEFVPEELVRKGFAYGVLDMEGMKKRIYEW